MRLKKISITNVSSLVDFQNDSEFSKNNLIFGTNGSGKSTLVELLYLVNKFHMQNDTDSENELKSFFRECFSKESSTDLIKVELLINSNNVSITYNKKRDTVKSTNSIWAPIKVFSEEYTNRTIGKKFQIDLQSSGIVIGETNIQLDKAYELRENLSNQREEKLGQAEGIINNTISDYRMFTKSNANVDNIICISTILGDSCELKYDQELLERRKKLGFGPIETSLAKLDEEQVKMKFQLESIERTCMDKLSPPEISSDMATLLRKYTEFYNKGLEIFKNSETETCPFCLRDWPNAEERINEYVSFIKSTYNIKRDGIKDIIHKLQNYKNQVERQIDIVEEKRKIATKEAEKYGVDMTKWLPLEFDKDRYTEIVGLLEKKYDHMDLPVSILNELTMLQDNHLRIIRNNNKIISEILGEINSISSRRREINKELVDHFAKQMWLSNSSLRNEIKKIDELIASNEIKIKKLAIESPPQDVVKVVFNSLLDFIGLSEYFIDDNKRLKLRLDQEYDISAEGKRISSAQRKILSLCYFFAEIVSEIKNPKDFQKYILVFDDPVDSSDYIYFHSITSVIEKAEVILALMLGIDKVKFGQFFVLTHNSLLHDRLSCGWKCKSKSIKKENGVTVMRPAEKTINNYNEYIGAICSYYKNPVSQKSRKIYIGNMIRRVLEILASFDNLETNSFQDILDGMGKPKLAILANHLSHESFSKVLNPLPGSKELREACREVLEVIENRHPAQFDTIRTKFEIDWTV